MFGNKHIGMSTSLRPNVSPSHTSSHHVLNRADSRRDHQYTKLYSELDAHGYHSSNSTAGEIELIPLLKALNRTGPEHSVLSLGCGVCAALPVYRSELRVDMYGTDVSTVAYQHAADLGRVNSTCSAKPCLRVGMAFAIPWPSASFDTAVSSDVMEHVDEADIPRSVSEASRVVRCLLLLAIARGSSVRNGIELHATQRNTSWWRDIYTRNGDWVELDVPRQRWPRPREACTAEDEKAKRPRCTVYLAFAKPGCHRALRRQLLGIKRMPRANHLPLDPVD